MPELEKFFDEAHFYKLIRRLNYMNLGPGLFRVTDFCWSCEQRVKGNHAGGKCLFGATKLVSVKRAYIRLTGISSMALPDSFQARLYIYP